MALGQFSTALEGFRAGRSSWRAAHRPPGPAPAAGAPHQRAAQPCGQSAAVRPELCGCALGAAGAFSASRPLLKPGASAAATLLRCVLQTLSVSVRVLCAQANSAGFPGYACLLGLPAMQAVTHEREIADSALRLALLKRGAHRLQTAQLNGRLTLAGQAGQDRA